jgi:hypothetical protein
MASLTLPKCLSFLLLLVLPLSVLLSSATSATTNQTNLSSRPPISKTEQNIAKIKITSSTRGQQVPVGKDLTISGTSIDNATSNYRVS